MNWNKQTQEEIGSLLNVSLYPGSGIMKDVCCQFVNKHRVLIREGALVAYKVIFKQESDDKYDQIRTQLLTDIIGWFFPTPLKDGLSEDNINKLTSVLQRFLIKVYNHVLYDATQVSKPVTRVMKKVKP